MLEGSKIDILSCHDTITPPIDIDSFFCVFVPFISKESFIFCLSSLVSLFPLRVISCCYISTWIQKRRDLPTLVGFCLCLDHADQKWELSTYLLIQSKIITHNFYLNSTPQTKGLLMISWKDLNGESWKKSSINKM